MLKFVNELLMAYLFTLNDLELDSPNVHQPLENPPNALQEAPPKNHKETSEVDSAESFGPGRNVRFHHKYRPFHNYLKSNSEV